MCRVCPTACQKKCVMETKNFNLIVKLKVTLHCTLAKIVIFMTSVVATLGTNSDNQHPYKNTYTVGPTGYLIAKREK